MLFVAGKQVLKTEVNRSLRLTQLFQYCKHCFHDHHTIFANMAVFGQFFGHGEPGISVPSMNSSLKQIHIILYILSICVLELSNIFEV